MKPQFMFCMKIVQTDNDIVEKAWARVKSRDSYWREKLAAWGVTDIMKSKRKFGRGIKKRNGKLEN